MTDSQKHIIGLVFYPGMTSLDIVGPQQVFSALPGIQIPSHLENTRSH